MWRCDDLTIVEKFILEIDALHCVSMLSYKDDQMRRIRPSLLKKHGDSLRHLRAELGVRDDWQLEDFSQVADLARNLQSLTATLGVVRDTGNRGSMWPGDGASLENVQSPTRSSSHHPLLRIPRTQKLRSY